MEDSEPAPSEADDFWVDVEDARPEEPMWLIKGVLPVGLVFIGGPAKTYKTTELIGFANLVSGYGGGLFPPFMSKVERGGICMILEAEANPGEVRHMIEKDMGLALGTHGRIKLARDCADFRLDDPDALKRLLFWLEKYQPRLFAIDPMREFHDLDEKDSGEMQRLLRPLRRWAIDHESCFLVVHHTTKPGEQHTGVYNPLDLRGSSALFGAANGVIMVSPTKVEGQVIMATKFKRGASWTREIQLGIFGNKASEVMKAEDRKLLGSLRDARTNASGQRLVNEGYLASLYQAPQAWVKEILAKLERNGLARKSAGGWSAV